MPPHDPVAPPPGISVDPSIPGNEPGFKAVMWPVGLIGNVFKVNGDLHIHDPQLGTTARLLDPGNILDGWVGIGMIDVSGVYDGTSTLLVCRAVPYAAVDPSTAQPYLERYYNSDDCAIR